MKSIQPKKEEGEITRKSLLLGFVGFISWIFIFIVFDPLAGLYKIGNFDIHLTLLSEVTLYIQSLFIGLLFFLFFYLTIKYQQKNEKAGKIVMWAGIVLYALFYLGYLFLLFFFRFTDL